MKPTQTNTARYGKKATEKSRYRLFDKITVLFTEMNETLLWSGLHIETNTEYIPEQLAAIAERYREVWKLDQKTFVYGKGHRKSVQQRQYEKLLEYKEKLEEYVEKMDICGENRNSYPKTGRSLCM